MKITIDIPDLDLTQIETMIARALVRTVRTLARDKLLPWITGGVVNTPIEGARDPDVGAPASTNGHAAEATSDPTPETPPPVFNQHYPMEPVPRVKATEPPPKPKPKKRDRHPLLDIVPTVAKRPVGYIDIPTAADAIGGTDNVKVQLYTWIKSKQINAVIVAGVTPPSKGLPGRLMVSRAEVLERNTLRMHNASLPAIERRAAPKLAEQRPVN